MTDASDCALALYHLKESMTLQITLLYVYTCAVQKAYKTEGLNINVLGSTSLPDGMNLMKTWVPLFMLYYLFHIE